MVELNGTLLIQIFNFIILCAILGFFCYKPVLKVLDDRKARIKNDLDSAAQSKAAAEELKVSYEAQLKDAQAKAQEIVDKASVVLIGSSEALKLVRENCEVELYSDSAYVVNAFEKGWIYNWKKNNWYGSSYRINCFSYSISSIRY